MLLPVDVPTPVHVPASVNMLIFHHIRRMFHSVGQNKNSKATPRHQGTQPPVDMGRRDRRRWPLRTHPHVGHHAASVHRISSRHPLLHIHRPHLCRSRGRQRDHQHRKRCLLPSSTTNQAFEGHELLNPWSDKFPYHTNRRHRSKEATMDRDSSACKVTAAALVRGLSAESVLVDVGDEQSTVGEDMHQRRPCHGKDSQHPAAWTSI